MPTVPDIPTFMAKGLYQRAAFFGCHNKDTATLVFLPNAKFSYASNLPTSQFDYETKEVRAMIENGVQIATQGGDRAWPTCLGCAIVHKTAKSVPAQCAACLQKYCF
jgi:lysophospholipase